MLRFIVFGGKEETLHGVGLCLEEDMAKYGRRYNPYSEYTGSEGKRKHTT